MATPALGDAEFLFGSCEPCGKRVLTCIDFGPDDTEQRRCLHCDTLITGELLPATSNDLETHGYTVIEARTCGNGGGCRAGTCGVAKP